MSVVSVPAADIRQAAAELSKLSDGLEEHAVAQDPIDPRAVHHEGLKLEIEAFREHLRSAVALLREDTRETGNQLRITAAAYVRTDEAGADAITAAGN